MVKLRLLEARLAWHRGKANYRRKQLAKWQAAETTAHYWKNAKGLARAQKFVLKWHKLLVPEVQEINRLVLAIAALKQPRPTEYVTMFDSIEPSMMPSSAEAVAGYVGGKWPTYHELAARFPKAKRLSIAVNASENAECLDIEAGDATPAHAPTWFHRQRAFGVKKPVFYASLSVIPEVIAALSGAGIHRSEYRLWSAHYTYKPHVDPACDATQWTDRALGRNLDQSLCTPSFFMV